MIKGCYMNEKQKTKMAELKKQMQAKRQEQILQNNVLYQECLTALWDYLIIDDTSEVERITHIAGSKDAEMHSHEFDTFLMARSSGKVIGIRH